MMSNVKKIEFKIDDHAAINKILGQRGELNVSARIEYFEDMDSYHHLYTFTWKSSFTEESATLSSDEEHAIERVLVEGGVVPKMLFTLKEGIMYPLMEDAQYLLFVSNAMGGHTNTVHPDISSLEKGLEMFFRNTEKRFNMDEVRMLEVNDNLWYELPDSSWFTITKTAAPSSVVVEEEKAFPSNMEVFLTFSTDQWQSNTSYQLEGVSSTLEEARRVVEKIFDEYGCDTKAVIRAANVDFQDFSDVEVYDYDSGLEWKTDDSSIENSDVDYGYLAQSLEEEGEDA